MTLVDASRASTLQPTTTGPTLNRRFLVFLIPFVDLSFNAMIYPPFGQLSLPVFCFGLPQTITGLRGITPMHDVQEMSFLPDPLSSLWGLIRIVFFPFCLFVDMARRSPYQEFVFFPALLAFFCFPFSLTNGLYKVLLIRFSSFVLSTAFLPPPMFDPALFLMIGKR